jgi:endoglucanase
MTTAVIITAALVLACPLPGAAYPGNAAHAGSVTQQDLPEQIANGTFDAGTAPWWWTQNTSGSVVSGQLCADVPAATANPWDVIVGQNDVHLGNGQSYTFSFTASASQPVSVRAQVQLGDPPYTAQLSEPVALGAAQRFTYSFTSGADTERGQVAFQVGGSAQGWTFCLTTFPSRAASPRRPTYRTPDHGYGSTRSATCPTGPSTRRSSPTPLGRCPGS